MLFVIQGVEVLTNIQMRFLLQFDFVMLAVCPNRVFIVLMTSFLVLRDHTIVIGCLFKLLMQYLPFEVIVV